VPRVLIVDDEPHIVELAKLYLERDGYTVSGVGTGEAALERLGTFGPDLVILDLMLPDIDGFEVCRRMRAKSDVPILMLTARKEDIDKIVGLEMGADDYSTKPFNPRELVARVKAILRRYRGEGRPQETMTVGEVRIDLPRHEVTVGGTAIRLRSKEFDLLAALAQNLGIVLSREKLLEIVWGYDYYGETRTVDVHIKHLRDKLGASSHLIETVRGSGYRMAEVKDER
jgi:DNA-binding response OmpR family regulator